MPLLSPNHFPDLSRSRSAFFASYLRGGFWGAWAGGWAFILPNFLIVVALAALYVHFGGLSWMTAIFLWGQPRGYRVDPPFLLAPGKTRHGRLVTMGNCGRLFCRDSCL